MSSIFLTSQASEVLEKICTFLPKQPSEYRVAFIPTAARPYLIAPWVAKDKNKLKALGFKVSDLELDGATPQQVREAMEGADIIFVAGGNTFYLLEKVKKSGFDIAAREIVKAGKIYIGSSAGSVLAAPDIKYVEYLDDPQKANLEDYQGLGLVDFCVLPHAGRAKYTDRQEKILESDSKHPIVPLTDSQFVVVNEDGPEVISV